MQIKWISVVLVGLLLAGCGAGTATEQRGEEEPSSVTQEIEAGTAAESEADTDGMEEDDSGMENVAEAASDVDTDGDVLRSKERSTLALPDLRGKTLVEARTALASFHVQVVERHHGTVKKGVVIRQSPEAGPWTVGEVVKLEVSLGAEPKAAETPAPAPAPAPAPQPEPKPEPTPEPRPEPVVETIPLRNGVGENLESFRKELVGAGFEVSVSYVHHGSVPKDRIVSMSPAAAGPYPKGTKVALVGSLGPEPVKEEPKSGTALPTNHAFQYESLLESEILRLLNAYRAENGLAALELRQDLQTVARWKSNSMLQYDYFGHDNPMHGDVGPIQLVRDIFGYKHYYGVGENLHVVTYIQAKAEDIMQAWKNSPGHNGNMLHPQWKYVGVGVVSAKSSGSTFRNREVLLSTQMFAR